MMIKDLGQLQEGQRWILKDEQSCGHSSFFKPIPFWLVGRTDQVRGPAFHTHVHVKVGWKIWRAASHYDICLHGEQWTHSASLHIGEWRNIHTCMHARIIESFAATGVGCCCSRCHYLEELLLDWSAHHSWRACLNLNPSLHHV